jgi:hypothetical protein
VLAALREPGSDRLGRGVATVSSDGNGARAVVSGDPALSVDLRVSPRQHCG